ncbi:MAG: M15 family metallopeptidase [Chitinophagaceae bacterium]|nr:M15 family metallopeptidase [Chitinophagaceae bacterium]
MKLKKNNTIRKKPNYSVSKSFDDGEILVQSKSSGYKKEYVVQSSITDIPFEEYVVVNEAPVAMQSAVDVNLFYTPSQTYSTDPYQEVNPGVSSSDNEKLSMLDNIAANHSPAPEKQSASTQSSFEYLDAIPEISGSASANEDDFARDMQAILTGKKVFDPVNKKTVDKSALQNPQPNKPPKNDPPSPPLSENKHIIFDQIAKSMEFAEAYDLGSIDLEKRFSDFDKIMDLQDNSTVDKTAKKSTTKSIADSEDFIKDLDLISKATGASTSSNQKTEEPNLAFSKQSIPETPPVATEPTTIPAPPVTTGDPALSSPNWPPRPTNIRPLTSSERAQLYGTFPYEADPSTFDGDGIRVTNDWRTQNIISVSIPQLNGKLIGRNPITNGTINFHRAGATALQNLWRAWEAAGLLDRVINFQGGYAARYIRNSQSRSPRPLSNHAWGTAFDINANWNGFGAQPALVGHQGSVRELVAIANQHGFFWGGHFRSNLDGMHFELAKILT